MTQDEAFHKIVLFFYLVTLNDKKTLDLAIKASQLYQDRLAPKNSHFDSQLTLIEICNDLLRDLPLQQLNSKLNVIHSTILIWPEHLDFNPWREFHKRSTLNERISVIWIHILGLPVQKLAHNLASSEGTVRYRLNKGLSLLGQLNRPNFGTA